MKTSHESIEEKINDFFYMFNKEVMKIDRFCARIKDNVDVLMGETCTLIDDIRAFNKEYYGELKLEKEVDVKVFASIENSLIGFHESLVMFDLSTTSISKD